MNYTSLYLKVGCKALGLAMAFVAVIALQHGSAFAQSKRPQQTGTITIEQVQVAWLKQKSIF